MTVLRPSRRMLLPVALGGSLIAFGQGKSPTKTKKKQKEEEEDVSPAEDLMREHGILKRVLLIYRESADRIDAKKDLAADIIPSSAKLIRDFIEQYHEKLEEEYLFPRFRKAGQQVELVDTLQQQHEAGRKVTNRIIELTRTMPKDDAGRRELTGLLRSFVRMYEPHEAREDTVLFPAFRRIVSKHEYDSLGEDFEKKEHGMFGEEGFEKNVETVASLEKKLGVFELSQFTPTI